jgi:hypothetical protein
VTQFIETLKKNPVWTFAWSILTLSVGTIVHYEFRLPEREAFFGRKTTELEEMSGEVERARKVADLWEKSIKALNERQEATNKIPDRDFLPDHLEATTQRIIDQFGTSRRELSVPLGVLRNAYFRLPALQELRGKLIEDLDAMDLIISKRITFMEACRTDIVKARQMAPTIKSMLKRSGEC